MILPGIALSLAGAILRDRMHDRLERWQRRLDSGSRKALRWIVGVVLFLTALPSEIAITIG